jgi:two-component system, OmpR family, sensor kinase
MEDMQARQVFWWFRSSLPARLALAVVIFIGAIAAVDFFSLDRLVHVERVSSEVRNRWLDSVRLLGDLKDRVSDLRAAEAEVLLSRDAPARDSRSAELTNLVNAASRAMERYHEVPHDQEEAHAFAQFAQRWTEHVENAQRVASLARTGETEAAAALFDGAARASFHSANDELHGLIDLTEGKAEAARNNAAEAIGAAQRWISDLTVGILLLFVCLVGYVWWAVSRPILRLSGLMRRLARRDTDFSVPFETWQDEVGNLARALGVFRRDTIELLESRANAF